MTPVKVQLNSHADHQAGGLWVLVKPTRVKPDTSDKFYTWQVQLHKADTLKAILSLYSYEVYMHIPDGKPHRKTGPYITHSRSLPWVNLMSAEWWDECHLLSKQCTRVGLQGVSTVQCATKCQTPIQMQSLPQVPACRSIAGFMGLYLVPFSFPSYRGCSSIKAGGNLLILQIRIFTLKATRTGKKSLQISNWSI